MIKILVVILTVVLCFPICVCAEGNTEIQANDEHIRYVGRWVENDKGYKVGNFEGEIVIRFSGTSLFSRKGSSGNMYVSVDGGEKTYVSLSSKSIAENLTDGEHTVKLYSPSQNSHPIISGFSCDGSFLEPETNKTIEFIGDSILEGYVKSGVNSSVISYGTIAAEILGYERNIVAYGGITMTPGYGNPDKTGMVTRYFYEEEYDSSNATQEYNTWDTSLYVPDIILINLGTNDNTSVPDGLFTTNAVAFYQKLRKCYPDTVIFVMVPIGEQKKEAVENAYNIAKSSVDNLYLIESTAIKDCPTADGLHPETESHITVAKYVAEEIKKVLDTPSVTEAPEITESPVIESNIKKSTPVIPVAIGAGITAGVIGGAVAVGIKKKKNKDNK